MPSLFNTGIRPAIDNYLLSEAAKVRDYGDYFSASSAGYCMRRLILERLGVPPITKESDGRKQRVFSSGHIFHNWIQEITKTAGLSIAQEIELQDESLMVRGHIDDLVLIEGGLDFTGVDELQKEHPGATIEVARKKHLILYDYKTVNSRAFLWAKKNGNAMSYYHRMQVGTYMYMLRKAKSLPIGDLKSPVKIDWKQGFQGLSEARILKIEKDTLMMMEQQLLYTPELEAEVLGYWRSLNGYWKAQKLPTCTCADHEGGFLAKEAYNPFFYDGEPCSLEWYKKFKKEKASDLSRD